MPDPDFRDGEPIELFEDIRIPTLQLLVANGKESTEPWPFLPEGRYIVEDPATIAVHKALVLAVADWDPEGRITLHHKKIKFVVQGKKDIEALRAALQSHGPLEWFPKD